jgi:hypothetical protein
MTRDELERRDPTGTLGPRAAPAGPAPDARSTSGTTFDGAVASWQDVPPETKACLHLGDMLARDVTVDRTTATVVGGRKYQVMHVWWASTEAVVVARALRRLTPADAGRLRPGGRWEHDRATTCRPSIPPTRRRGTVAAGTGTAGPGPTWVGAPARALPRSQAEGARIWTYLPAEVRAGAEAVVPAPDVWRGSLVQRTTAEGFACSHRLTALRMSSARAVVLVAEREIEAVRSGEPDRVRSRLARAAWDVTQWTYDFRTVAASDRRLDHAPR